MCGITGFIGEGNESVLKRMVAAVEHRGPDDTGIFFDKRSRIGLGHARLSILDVSSAGHQPMWNEGKTIAVIFNGEIYNFAELRRELESEHRCRFKSGSDTEAILRAYEAFGERCFEKMDGMFAIAIYDADKGRLILARDRMGKKPLYYGGSGGALLFGSELKSLVLHPSFKRAVDLESVNKYLQFDFIPTPHTIWKDIRKLEPGAFAVFEVGRGEGRDSGAKLVRKEPFWKPDFKPSSVSFEAAKKKLDGMIDEAVKGRMVADVSVGVFLSGGLDSSAVAYYAKRNSASQRDGSSNVKTFSIGFDEKSFDESSYAREVAGYLGTEHHEKIFAGQDSVDVISHVLKNLDEPMADASIIPAYLLSRFAREHVTVALGGDGGDELFAGYPTFQAEKLASAYGLIPAALRRSIIEPSIKALPSSSKNFSLDFKLKKFIDGFGAPEAYRHQVWLGSFDRAERAKLFRPEIWKKLEGKNEFEDVDRYHAECASAEKGNRTLYEYERMYLMDEVLVKVDRATMLASLEARSPLLDHRLAGFVHSLPYSYKLHGWNTKFILKRLMAGKLPDAVIKRQKKGFGMPVAEWLRGPLKPLLEDVLSEKSVKDIGLFDYAYIARLKDEHHAGRADHRKSLWNMLVFGIWWRNFNSKQ